MAEFKRYLSGELLGALNKLADPEAPANWWQEVLDSKDLHLAVRGGYLNAYAQGQSVFKIGPGLDTGNPLVSIHYKYLLEPSLAPGREYIPFNGKSFLVKPCAVICTKYEPGHTLPRLIAAASPYAEEEKKGVHVMVTKNPTVVDLEIAFTQKGEAGENERDRIDFAALHEDGDGKAKLVFYEVKRADDPRLRAGSKGEDPEVVEQMERYDRFLGAPGTGLEEAYKEVCATLVKLCPGRSRPLSQLIKEVGAERPTRTLSVDPVARLLVFGFDRDQKDGGIFRCRIETLQKRLGDRVVAKGNPASFDLLEDYKPFPQPAPQLEA